MPYIRLGDEDRERLGCEEWVAFPDSLPVADAEAIDDNGGDYLDFFKKTARGFKTQVWVGLHRGGVTVPLGAFTFDLRSVRLEDNRPDPGKAPSEADGSPTPPTSASSSRRSTRTRSRTST